jgi:hypothetical protein
MAASGSRTSAIYDITGDEPATPCRRMKAAEMVLDTLDKRKKAAPLEAALVPARHF